MWSYAQSTAAYKALTSEQLSFWQNIYQVYCMFSDASFGGPAYDSRPRSPLAIFHQSAKAQYYAGKDMSNIQPVWAPGEIAWSVYPDSPIADDLHNPIGNQFIAPQFFDYAYPAPGRKVRKSYWTGTPRRRRNL